MGLGGPWPLVRRRGGMANIECHYSALLSHPETFPTHTTHFRPLMIKPQTLSPGLYLRRFSPSLDIPNPIFPIPDFCTPILAIF
ncbi:hypothetical protein BS17DRAFT_776588 [Gyrodon lividus]|nr:hypothetical protein BS17DRAFT_776588 [Gyrodon lividus]